MPPKFAIVEKNVSGKVKWFNQKEGCGRILSNQHGEIFVHHSRITNPNNPKGDNFLKTSQNVVFNVLRGPKGLQADDVKVIFPQRNPRSSSVVSSERQRHASADSTESDIQEMAAPKMKDMHVIEKDLRGEVTEFDDKRRYGFVLIRQYGSVHCHASNIIFSGIDSNDGQSLQPTQIVKCDVGRDAKGMLFAVNIHVISGATKKSQDKTASRSNTEGAMSTKPSNTATKERKKDEPGMHDPENKSAGIIASDLLGEVIRYSEVKKFGFIQIQGYNSVYVHRNGLMKVDALKPKQIVKCDLTHGPKTLMALNVRVIADTDSSAADALPPLMTMKNIKNTADKRRQPQCQVATAPPPPPMNPMYPYPHAAPAYPAPMGVNFRYPQPNFMTPPLSYPPMEMPPPYQVDDIGIGHLNISDTATDKFGNKDDKSKKKKKKKESKPGNDGDNSNQLVFSKLNCEICEDPLDDPVTAPCEHLFCRECINEWLAVNPSCPVDGKAISRKSLKPAPLKIRELLDVKIKM